jgi:UDP-N-acetylmuramoylalanine--D-glutamate ligase
MRNTDHYENKKIAIVGLGRSGVACANLLYDLGTDVCATDNKDTDVTRSNVLKLKSKNIRVELGRHTQDFIKDKDLIVVSPGVPNNALPVIWAKDFKIPIISEIELGWDLCLAKIVAITGSNGKTTVTTLIGKM